jgi:hypothetical protein
MAAMGFKSLWSSVTGMLSGETSIWEGLTSALMSVSMILPTVGKGFKALGGAITAAKTIKAAYNAATAAGTKLTLKEAAANAISII